MTEPTSKERRAAERIREEKRRRRAVYAILVMLFALVVMIGYNQLFVAPAQRSEIREAGEDTEQNTREVRLSQFTGCVRNGNELRADVRHEFVDLKRTVLIPVFGQVAATIPPGSLSKEILDDAVVRMRARIKTISERIPPVNCLDRYPPLEDQVYPDDLLEEYELGLSNGST